MKNLVLVGFMGSGKSTIGRIVADQLGLHFVDVDQWIEKKTGILIADIFKKRGEESFRMLETQAIQELAVKDYSVIATGGGVVLRSENMEALSKNGILIHLRVDVATVIARTRNHTHRPLLATQDPSIAIQKLLMERQPLYEKTPHAVDTNRRLAKDIAQDVIAIYQRELQG